ncbi:FGGY-family carbohydrate kinase [Streptomyces sp. NBC_00859]|uniref:FGGY-family carbohydrate kinase n=1 Tax=Streptomyces sp. NBC_00859 TaxID=2903682 RepID=UPI0038709594|nr:FGGY family carbohydrate kinase [Streptomyces sp. NBC_00859]
MSSAVSHGPAPVPVVAGIDVATAAVRVVCADAAGRVLAEGRAPISLPERGAGGRSEQDARSWWPATAAALRQATTALPGGGREVVAVAVSATSGTLVLAGPGGEPAGPALMYDDRSAAAVNARAQELGAPRWRALGLTVGPTAALGKLVGYAARALPGQLVLHTPDLLGLKLTGHPVATDWSHALKTGYDARAGEWADEVFDAFGVPSELLPAVRAPGTQTGTVSAQAAAETGLPAGCQVRLGMTDGCTGQIATGAVDPGRFVGVLGTTYVLKGVTRELVTDPAGALYSHRHPDGWWLPGGASNTGGEAVARFDPARLPGLDAAADAQGPSTCVAYPLRREGERFPFVSSQARGFRTGLPRDETDEYRAALEGVAFLERLAVERVQALGVEVRGPLYAAGGGSRSAVWNRIRATVLDRPLNVAERAETAIGAALLAASGTLHPDLSAAVGAMVGAGRTVDPLERERAALDASYGEFVTELRSRGWLSPE